MSAREGARNVLVKLQTGRGRREASPATSPEIRGPCDAHRPVGVRLEHAAPAPCGDPIDCWAPAYLRAALSLRCRMRPSARLRSCLSGAASSVHHAGPLLPPPQAAVAGFRVRPPAANPTSLTS